MKRRSSGTGAAAGGQRKVSTSSGMAVVGPTYAPGFDAVAMKRSAVRAPLRRRRQIALARNGTAASRSSAVLGLVADRRMVCRSQQLSRRRDRLARRCASMLSDACLQQPQLGSGRA
jgi:hypothetical protein